MPEYRLYPIKDDGHIAGPAEIVDYPDDRTAIEHAREFATQQPVEIWLLDRRVTRINPDANAT